MPWTQVRECDGVCCNDAPRFPTEDGKSCIYLDPQPGKERCKIMRGEEKLPRGRCPVLPKMTAKAAFEWTCASWPQEFPKEKAEPRCCWQWVESGD